MRDVIRRLLQGAISTALEELVIAAIALWGLPLLGVRIPLWGTIAIMVAWAAYSTFTHFLGARALAREHLVGLPNMVGCRGSVVSTLNPEGLIRIKGELWVARSAGGKVAQGNPVIVIGQERLKLIVRESGDEDTS
ncbi:MAG: hypothetical protein HYX80_03125 [Chloroflexi bacterium]|nr:hypothetical protein [Chloroflexota bacterium]